MERVMRFGMDAPYLARGMYLTEEEMERRMKEFLAYDFGSKRNLFEGIRCYFGGLRST